MGETNTSGHTPALPPARDLAGAWLLMAVLAAFAWALTVAQARDTGVAPGTMGMAVPLFLALWLVMMIAMMVPSVAPVALTWARGITRPSTGLARTARTTAFVGAYLVVWTAFGLVAYGLLALTGDLVADHPGAGRWIGAAAFALAGLQQLGPLKNVCLRHCRSPMSQPLTHAGHRPRAHDLRAGAHHGMYCLGCCWGLMILLVPLGVMNTAAMAAVAALIFLEKLWRHGPALSRAAGIAFLVLAVLCVTGPPQVQDWLLPGLTAPAAPMAPMGMTGAP
ncbi:DUF2182 domain-containing protein [Streptomyces sp. NPDC004267]|uniref:DUF2182 domain-containing protein n=1 Tax=Streptomyces sp. NPDC004267 TaxID=3364694 RepID=UPI003689F9CE